MESYSIHVPYRQALRKKLRPITICTCAAAARCLAAVLEALPPSARSLYVLLGRNATYEYTTPVVAGFLFFLQGRAPKARERFRPVDALSTPLLPLAILEYHSFVRNRVGNYPLIFASTPRTYSVSPMFTWATLTSSIDPCSCFSRIPCIPATTTADPGLPHAESLPSPKEVNLIPNPPSSEITSYNPPHTKSSCLAKF